MFNDRQKLTESNRFWAALLACLVIAFFYRYLFTTQIIRASDVLSQLFWSVKGIHQQSFLDYLEKIPEFFRVNWEPMDNGGRTGEGGGNPLNLLFYRYLVFQYFPFPANIAWLAVLSLAWGGIGTFFYCRAIGVSRFGAFAAGLLFAACTENSSLINAGHIQKIETISWLPWVLLSLEKALRTGRLYHYSITALLLAVQFFTMHWQISFYSCLAVGAYWFFFTGARFKTEKGSYAKPFGRDVLLAVAMVTLFFTTTAMSFIPLVNFSKQSERGGAEMSGGSSGGGMNREEGMSWSMPPEEVLTFIVPGLVGYSRQEAGDNPAAGQVFYWGRMHFTQTNDYLGMLPWLLLPLPLIFRRDRHTWFFVFLLSATLVMALGKYTFVYRFMFDHLPGFATFRVPKMILFLFAFAAAVLMGRGFDILAEFAEERKKLGRWLAGLLAFTGLLAVFALVLRFFPEPVLSMAAGVIDQPTRFQSGGGLIQDRYIQMMRETALACGFLCAYLLVLLAWFWKKLPVKYLLPGLLILLLADLWRVNTHFTVLCPPPVADKKQTKNDIVDFIGKNIGPYRMQALDGTDSFYYSDFGIPNISAYVTISERRYREYLDSLSLLSSMPDIMNLKYLVMAAGEYQSQEKALSAKYRPVFSSSTGSLVLENRTVMPKAWLASSVAVIAGPQQRLAALNSQGFDPAAVAIVESQPPIPVAMFPQRSAPGVAEVRTLERNRIVVATKSPVNSMLVLGEKYYKSWRAELDGRAADIQPADHILRGVYVPAGEHTVEFIFDSVPFKVGKYLTLGSFAFIAALLVREALLRRRKGREAATAER